MAKLLSDKIASLKEKVDKEHAKVQSINSEAQSAIADILTVRNNAVEKHLQKRDAIVQEIQRLSTDPIGLILDIEELDIDDVIAIETDTLYYYIQCKRDFVNPPLLDLLYAKALHIDGVFERLHQQYGRTLVVRVEKPVFAP